MKRRMIAILMVIALVVTFNPGAATTVLAADADVVVTDVSLEFSHSAAVTSNGDLYCWGWNEYGQIGNI